MLDDLSEVRHQGDEVVHQDAIVLHAGFPRRGVVTRGAVADLLVDGRPSVLQPGAAALRRDVAHGPREGCLDHLATDDDQGIA